VLYVFTLGFHADHIIRRLSRSRSIESIVIFTAKPVVRAVVNTFKEVLAFCDRARLPIPRLVEIPPDDAAESIYIVLSELGSWDKVVADLSGGMRSIVVLVLTALLIHSMKSYVVIYTSAEREDLPEFSISLDLIRTIMTKSLSREKFKIVQEIMKTPGITITELAQTLNKSEKTIRNYLAELKRLELIKIKGPKQNIYPTKWAEIIKKIQQ